MKLETIEIKKLTASNGKVLTNGETYSKEVYLGVNDSPDNWYEITETEYNAILETQKNESEMLIGNE